MLGPEVQNKVREYLLANVLSEQDAGELDASTPLISTGVLDSVDTLGLTAFLEEEFGVALAAHEINVDNLDTVERIVALVLEKSAA